MYGKTLRDEELIKDLSLDLDEDERSGSEGPLELLDLNLSASQDNLRNLDLTTFITRFTEPAYSADIRFSPSLELLERAIDEHTLNKHETRVAIYNTLLQENDDNPAQVVNELEARLKRDLEKLKRISGFDDKTFTSFINKDRGSIYKQKLLLQIFKQIHGE